MFDPVRVCRILNGEGVEYVVVGGFDGWHRAATAEEISDGLSVLVGSLDDVIDSKRAANRLKDQRDLPYLESLRDQIERG